MNGAVPADESARIAKVIGDAVARSFSLSSGEIEEVFSGLKDRLLSTTNGEWECLEIRRRLAEARISLFYDRVDGHLFFDRAFDELEEIGYSNFEREATSLFYKAKNLILQRRQPEIGLVLDRFERLIEDQISTHQPEMAEHFRRALANLRKQT